jgi:hypothetical protein
MSKGRISKQHSIKDNKYGKVPSALPNQQVETPGQGYNPMHGGDVLSLANVPQPGSPMTKLFANDQGDQNQ